MCETEERMAVTIYVSKTEVVRVVDSVTKMLGCIEVEVHREFEVTT